MPIKSAIPYEGFQSIILYIKATYNSKAMSRAKKESDASKSFIRLL